MIHQPRQYWLISPSPIYSTWQSTEISQWSYGGANKQIHQIFSPVEVAKSRTCLVKSYSKLKTATATVTSLLSSNTHYEQTKQILRWPAHTLTQLTTKAKILVPLLIVDNDFWQSINTALAFWPMKSIDRIAACRWDFDQSQPERDLSPLYDQSSIVDRHTGMKLAFNWWREMLVWRLGPSRCLFKIGFGPWICFTFKELK